MINIPFNILFCIFLGFCLTACARTQLLSGAQPWRSDLFLPVVSFALLGGGPAFLYLYLLYPEWSWMYLVDPSRLPRGTTLAAVVVSTLMVPLGYLLGWFLLRLVSPRALAAVLGGLGMGLLLFLVLGRGRLFYLGRYEDFQAAAHAYGVKPLSQGKLLWALVCIVPACLASFAVAALHLWGQGRWLRQQALGQIQQRIQKLQRSQPESQKTGTGERARTPTPETLPPGHR